MFRTSLWGWLMPIFMLGNACLGGEVRVVSWNVESGGADAAVVAGEFASLGAFDVLCLCEVAKGDAPTYIAAAGRSFAAGSRLSATGCGDRLLVIWNRDRFEDLASEDVDDLAEGCNRDPMAVKLREKPDGAPFWLMVNHLNRGVASTRNNQSNGVRLWISEQSIPTFAVGDYNFDFDVTDQDGNAAYHIMFDEGGAVWVRPAMLVRTEDSHDSVLDFAIANPLGMGWNPRSRIIVRGDDFTDEARKSDHRPIDLVFDTAAVVGPVAVSSDAERARARVFRDASFDGGGGLESFGDVLRKTLVAPGVEPGSAASSPMAATLVTMDSKVPLAAATEFKRPYETRLCMPGVPPQYATRIEEQRLELERILAAHGGAGRVRSVISIAKKWERGRVLSVAFRGGDRELHARIASAADGWMSHAGISLDFGFDATTNSFRQWSPSDRSYAADIRIGFNDIGYWSLVGSDCRNPRVVRPGEPSMNLEAFDVDFPANGAGVVLHEFGHALGFEHEHSHPATPCDFRWEDDPQYVATRDGHGQFMPDPSGRRPGVYTVLGGPPNRWDRRTVDDNLRALAESSAFETSAFDNASIMKYPFPAWMFVSGARSHCFSDLENLKLSDLDKSGLVRAYPMNPAPDAERERVAMELTNTQREVVASKDREALRTIYEAVAPNPLLSTRYVTRRVSRSGGETEPATRGEVNEAASVRMVAETRTRLVPYYRLDPSGTGGAMESREEEYTVMVPAKSTEGGSTADEVTALVEEESPLDVKEAINELLTASPSASREEIVRHVVEMADRDKSKGDATRKFIERELEWSFRWDPASGRFLRTGDEGGGEGAGAAGRASAMPVAARSFGQFLGKVVTEWDVDGRSMTLREDFRYVDPRDKVWIAEAGTVINGASIPRALWTAIGGPFEGEYRLASVVHDAHCVKRSEPWRSVHRMFLEACLCAGVRRPKADAMYFAVYHFGPRWERRSRMARQPDGSEVPEEYASPVRRRVPVMDETLARDIVRYFERKGATSPEQIEELRIEDISEECEACAGN